MRAGLWLIAIVLLVSAVVPVSAAQEVIVDNPGASFVGTWTTATSATNKYGDNYRYCNISTSGSNTATYTPTIPVTASDWQVFTWYPTVSQAYSATRHIVHHAGGDTTVNIAQGANQGTWVSLGTFTMNAGSGNYVRITNYGTSTSRRAVADAIRFYSASAADSTPPVITDIASSPASSQATITWTTDEPATSQVEYGTTTSYGSQTAKDTNLVLSHSVTITGLTQGQLYHFRVKSEDAYTNLQVSSDYTFTTTIPVPEYRALWANTWNSGVLGSSQFTTCLNMMTGANYNVFIPEVRKCGDAYYNFTPVQCACGAYHTEPRATNIVDPAPYDLLQDEITRCHAAGIKVYGWMVTYRIWSSNWGAAPAGHVWAEHPDWVMSSSTGGVLDGTNYNLDPGIPAVQDYVTKVALQLVTHYDVDGINWDYIRYPGQLWGYNAITKQRFYDEYGYYPPTSTSDPHWAAWCDYRRQQVTDLLKRIQLEIMAVRPQINHTICTVGWLGGDPNTDFTGTRQYYDVFQDTENWMNNHFVDTQILMNYKREYDTSQAPDYDLWTTWLGTLQSESGRHCIDGQACYLNAITDSVHQMGVARTAGIGICNYDYITTNKDSQPATDFFNAVKAGIYQDPAPVPDMPWKTAPTTGTLFGTVTKASGTPDPIYYMWLYKADVSISGPVTLSTQTDGTGTYGFFDLPAGTYSITVSKAGYPTRVITGVNVGTGDVVRKDVALGNVTVTSPAGVVVNGWSLLSLPVQPVNPDPSVVFNGIDIDGRLYKWDSSTQGLNIYDSWSPEAFGNLDIENGYWLDSASAGIISYEGIPSSAPSHDVVIPITGWAIIGCPFTSDKQWPNTTVTHAGTTASILDASHTYNWLNSNGYWWDASTQGLMDIGLPEDFASWETLQPWHGYWIQTFADDVTLTLQ